MGVWLFLEAINRRSIFLVLSVISFCLSIYTFNSARIVAPLLLVCLSLVYGRKLLADKKYLALSIIAGLVMVLPISGFLLSPQASLRFKEVNIFSDVEIVKTANQEIQNDNNAWWSKILHNRRIGYAREVTKHYFDNLSSDFLFIKGDGNPKFSTGDVGQMYLWDLPFFVMGFLFLIKRREKNWWIIPLWLLVGIIPASLARETPHALRIEGSLPMFQLIAAYGISEFLLWLKNTRGVLRKLRNPILALVALVLFMNVAYFLHGYYFHYAKDYSGEWQYGYKESMEYVKKEIDNYDSIHIGSSLGRPYIYTLFYMQYDPQKFRETAKIRRDVFGFVHIESFGKYNFSETEIKLANKEETALLIDSSQNIYKPARILKTFYLLNGKPSLVAFIYE